MTESNDPSYCILALYKFVSPKLSRETVEKLKNDLETVLRKHAVRGNLLLATEGINGTICYPREHYRTVLAELQHRFPHLRIRLSYSTTSVFRRLKIRIKNEIVTMGCEHHVDPTQQVGTYVPPGPDWDRLLQDPDCLVVDARNDYEVQIGSFHNAVNPHTQSFTELPAWLHYEIQNRKPKKIAMFCTGGIRCEKATSKCLESYKLPVYHLEGGILAYLDTVPQEESLFHGECFVFDQRVAVTHGLQASQEYITCYACRHPLNSSDRAQNSNYQPGLCCPYCVDESRRRQRYEDRQKQVELSQQAGVPHMHDPREQQLLDSK